MKITTLKSLPICPAMLFAGLLAFPAEVCSLQDQKKPDFEMVVQKGHPAANGVLCAAFTPDGKYIISGAADATLKLWNREGRLLKTFEGHSGWVLSLAVRPDGNQIASGSWDKTIKLWSVHGGLIRTIEGHSNAVKSVSFSPDGKHIVSGSYDNTIKLWDIEGNLIRTFDGHSDGVTSVSFSPDGKHIVSGAGDRTIKLWSIDGGLVRTLPSFFSFNGHSGIINGVAFSPDGKYIVSGADDKTIKLWSVKGRLLKTCEGHSDAVRSVAFSPDGKHIVSGSYDSTLKIWSMEGDLIRTFTGWAGHVESVSFGPDGRSFVAGSWNTTVSLWDIEKGLIRHFYRQLGEVMSLAFSPDGKYIISGDVARTLKLWDLNGKQIKTLEGHSAWIPSVAFSPDGKYIVSGSGDKTLRLWDMEGRILGTFQGHSGAVISIAFSPDGKHIVSGSRDNTIKLWTVAGKLIRTFEGHSNWVESVSFSPDGAHIASSSKDGTIKLWDINGKLVKTFKGDSDWVSDVSFSQDGKCVIFGSDGKTIKLWDIDGTLIRTFKGKADAVTHVAVSPDGKHIISRAADKTITLWSIGGRSIKEFAAPFPWSTAMRFHPDTKFIGAGSIDGTIKLWSVRTGDLLSLISAGNDWVIYTPDGYFDASPHGGELVAMVKGMEAYGVDQFAVRNNRPDLILERMGLGTPELITHYNILYQKRLKKLGLTEADLSAELHAPETKITATKQNGKFIDVSFSFSDSKYPLKRYNIYVNDVPLFGASGKVISGKSFNGTEKVELTAGRNKIELSAMNSAGAESFRALTYADHDGKEKGALYYLAFGASKYKDPTINLNYADKDVKDLETVLSKMRPAYSDIHVKTFLNSEVTPENIKKAKDFLKDAKTDDTVILAIAGHGGYSKGRDPKYYYVAYETDVNKLASTGVDFESIEDLLDGIKPRKKLFLMDTCESGELDDNVYENYYTLADARGMKPRTFRKPLKARGSGGKGRGYLYEKDRFIYNDLSRRTGAVVFSSSRGGEISYESSAIRNGFFTKEIINALTSKTADKNSDGRIDSGELRDFVAGAVSGATGGLQHPTIDRDNLYQKIDLPLVSN